ncbi:MAG TPA: hypothetical protein VGI34_00620, partial [Candidatus Acidoferrales bacterium]
MNISVKSSGKFHNFFWKFALGALLCATFGNLPAWADCNLAFLNALKIPNITIVSAAVVPAAALNPEYCDVKGSVVTSDEAADSGSANFEVMLPANWNQKFVFNGVGGLAG